MVQKLRSLNISSPRFGISIGGVLVKLSLASGMYQADCVTKRRILRLATEPGLRTRGFDSRSYTPIPPEGHTGIREYDNSAERVLFLP